VVSVDREPHHDDGEVVTVLKRSTRRTPAISIVLLDWSVRESFHLLHYLGRQSLPRDQFEVIVVEYYSRQSGELRRFLHEVDTWVLLDMPTSCCHHKHLMYNVGIALARGEVVLFCDSDAMVRDGFLAAITGTFARDPNIVLHLDQFRNLRRDFYPFNYPSFDEVIGRGCINESGGRTRGLASSADPLHERNYGAGMAARRSDLIAIGGADEHIDYLGHICGPYELTFRLMNSGRREVWHESEFLYHTWHPGQAGDRDYLGPHDGRHMSTTALEALVSGRVAPYVANRAIERLQEDPTADVAAIEPLLIRSVSNHAWRIDVQTGRPVGTLLGRVPTIVDYKGFRIRHDGARFVARLIAADHVPAVTEGSGAVLDAPSTPAARSAIDRAIGPTLDALSTIGAVGGLGWRALRAGRHGGRRYVQSLATMVQLLWSRGVRLITTRLGHLARRAWRLWRTGGVWRRLPRLARAVATYPLRLSLALVSGVRRLVARTHDLYRRFFMEERRYSGSLASLIVNLHFLKAHLGPEPTRIPGPARGMVIVDSRYSASYLRLLSTIGVLPKTETVSVQSPADLTSCLQRLHADIELPVVVIERECYQKHHLALSAASRRYLVV
jgi:hypothetical protein